MTKIEIINEELKRIHASLASDEVPWAVQDELVKQHAYLLQKLLDAKDERA